MTDSFTSADEMRAYSQGFEAATRMIVEYLRKGTWHGADTAKLAADIEAGAHLADAEREMEAAMKRLQDDFDRWYWATTKPEE